MGPEVLQQNRIYTVFVQRGLQSWLSELEAKSVLAGLIEAGCASVNGQTGSNLLQ
jgi:hypothetical protein